MESKADGMAKGLRRLQAPAAVLPWVLGLAAVSCPLFAYSDKISLWSGLLFLALLFFPALEDGMTGYISDGWSLALGLSGVGERLLAGDIGTLWGAALVFLFLGGLFLWKREAVGEGDVWLGGAIACWLPGMSALLFLWLAFLFGGAAGAARLCLGGKGKETMAFGPFLCLGGGAAYVWGDGILSWYGTFF